MCALCFLGFFVVVVGVGGDFVKYSVEHGNLLEIQVTCFRIHGGSDDLIVGRGKHFMAREVF